MAIATLFNRLSLGQKLTVVSGIFLLAGFLALWQLWSTSEAYQRVETFDHKVTKLTNRVSYLDEVLTMSTRMAAQTGDQRWIDRYEAHVGKMGDVLEKLRALAPDRLVDELNAQTSAANDKLISLEKKAYARIEAGELDAARAILNGEAYAQAKAKLTEGTDAFVNELREMVVTRRAGIETDAKRAIIFTAVGLLIAELIALFVGRSTSQRLREVINALTRLRQGDTTAEIHAVGRDEPAELTQAYETFRANEHQRRELEEREAEQQQIRERRQDARNQVIDIFGASIGGVMETVNNASRTMTERAQTLQSVVHQTEDVTQNVSRESDETASNAQELRAAIEEMVNSVQEINRQVSQSDEMAETARQKANDSAERVEKLRDAAESIENAVTLIQDIAEKTNLLALNATIEAARAGEAGKGFAVVANEVKSLASQTDKATEDIGGRVREIQSATRETADAMSEITNSIGQVRDYTSGIASAINEQDSTTQEMASNVTQVADRAASIAERVRSLEARTSEANQNASEVQETAGNLAADADVLSREVETFLNSVQASDEQAERLEAARLQIPATVTYNNRETHTQTRDLAPSFVTVRDTLPGDVGERVYIAIKGFSESLKARISRHDGSGTTLQLPMSQDHLDWVHREIRRIKSYSAAA